MSELVPEIWSDIDGTAMEKLSARRPRDWYRNARKRDLAMMEGYLEFLRGAESAGARVAGIASRRAEWMRRRTTARSIVQLGLDEFFDERRNRIFLAGSEKKKAAFVGERSRERRVGFLEDQPHDFVNGLVQYSLAERRNGNAPHHPLLVGVVSHDRSQEEMERLRLDLERTPYEQVHVRHETGTNTGLVVFSEPLTIHVTQLDPYSQACGEEFAQRLASLEA